MRHFLLRQALCVIAESQIEQGLRYFLLQIFVRRVLEAFDQDAVLRHFLLRQALCAIAESQVEQGFRYNSLNRRLLILIQALYQLS